MGSPTTPRKRKLKKKMPPAVSQREWEHLARMKRDLYRIEESNRELRRKLGMEDD
jgi:hypothetical protein